MSRITRSPRTRTRTIRWTGPVAGIAAAALAAGVGELLAAVVAPPSSPFAAIGSALIDLAPTWAKDVAIALFGTADKIALLIGIAIVLLAVAAGAGFLQRRRPPLGIIAMLALGAVGVLAAATRANTGGLSWLPSVAAGVAGALALAGLDRLARGGAAPDDAESGIDLDAAGDAYAPFVPASTRGGRDQAGRAGRGQAGRETRGGEPDLESADEDQAGREARRVRAGRETAGRESPDAGGEDPGTAPPNRRRFLAWSIAAVVVGAAAAAASAAARTAVRTVDSIRAAIRLPAPAQPAAAILAAAELDVPGLAPVVTPNADFYRIDTALVVPQVDPADWSLRIHGMVENEVRLTWQDLLELPLQEKAVTLACVSNQVGGSLIGNAVWLGYPVRDLLRRAAPDADADMVLSRSVDGFTAGTPIEALTDNRDALLAIGMNGEPLPVRHGFPARLVVPGLYGYVSATKWVTELKVTRFDADRAYWTDRGWSARGPVKLQSRIDVPREGSVSAGETVIAGVAWQQHTGVAAVEVQVDDGPWREAELAAAISDDTWVQWSLPWSAEPGEHTIRCRATNTDGHTQTEETRPVLPDGATGWHTRRITVG